MTWIESPIPKDWVGPDEGGMFPAHLETGFIAFCMNNHQWWERVSSPSLCPRCSDYHVSHRKPTSVQWFWHLLTSALSGIPVVSVQQYTRWRMSHGEEDQEKV